MKIVIGTKNKYKVRVVKEALKNLHLDVDIDSVEVDAVIPNQALDKETIKKRVVNQALGARKAKPKADFWIGLEEGLHEHNKGYHLVTFACLLDKNGGQYVDEGEEIHLPDEISRRVKNKELFGDVIREYLKDNEIDKNSITRFSHFTRAIECTYVEYLKQTTLMNFRQRISAVVMDKNENFLIVQLTSYGENDWNFSGGGIEEGEKPEEAVLRELKEEFGTDKFEVVKRSEYKAVYDWPNWLIASDIINKRKIFRGQEVTFFLIKFFGQKKDVKPDPKELRKVKWVKYSDIKKYFNFPWQIGLTDKLRDLFD